MAETAVYLLKLISFSFLATELDSFSHLFFFVVVVMEGPVIEFWPSRSHVFHLFLQKNLDAPLLICWLSGGMLRT